MQVDIDLDAAGRDAPHEAPKHLVERRQGRNPRSEVPGCHEHLRGRCCNCGEARQGGREMERDGEK